MKKGKSIRVRFRVVNGNIHLKNLQVTPEEYTRVAEVIKGMVAKDVLQGHNFNASFDLEL